MLFKQGYLFLFKTPLDSNYRNVYDDYNSLEDYSNFLSNNFPMLEIQLNSDVSRKNVGDLFSIVLDRYDSMDLHDYNYLAFRTRNGVIKFAFILSVESENDSSNPTCKLNCKLDAWSNNYIDIKNSFSSIKEYRCTYDTNTLPNLDSNIKQTKLNEKVEYHSIIHASADLSTFIPVWQRIVLSQPVRLTHSGSIFFDIDYTPNKNGHYVYYRYVGSLNYNNGNFLYTTYLPVITFTGKNLGSGSNISVTISPNTSFQIAQVKSSYVISNTLTVDVPFKYSVSVASSKVNITIDQNAVLAYGHDIAKDSTDIISYASNDMPIFYVLNYGQSVTKVFPVSPSSIEVYSSSKRYSQNVFYDVDSLNYEFPFYYYSISLLDGDISLLGENGNNNNYSIQYDCSEKMYPSLRIRGAGNKTLYLPVNNFTELPVTDVPLDEYMMRNSASMQTQQALASAKIVGAIVGTVAGAAMGMPIAGAAISAPMALSGTTDLVSIEAKKSDLENTPENVRISNLNSFAIPIPADMCFIKEHRATYPNDIIREYHIFGYSINLTLSLNKRRDLFDIDSGNLEFSAKISEEDKNTIINAISGGICRWHLGDWKNGSIVNTARCNILSGMNRNVTNYSISLIPV